MFAAIGFVITGTWEPSRCPGMGEQFDELWSLHVMENYSARKRNKPPTCEKTCVKLKGMILKHTHHLITSIEHSGNDKIVAMENRAVVPRP